MCVKRQDKKKIMPSEVLSERRREETPLDDITRDDNEQNYVE